MCGTTFWRPAPARADSLTLAVTFSGPDLGVSSAAGEFGRRVGPVRCTKIFMTIKDQARCAVVPSQVRVAAYR